MPTRKKTQRSATSSRPPATRSRAHGARADPAVDDYLTRVSPKCRVLLQELRSTIHSLVPAIEECISYGMPAFRLNQRIVAGFAATSAGCSYYPFSGSTFTTLAAELAGYVRTKSALHFGPAKPLPASLVRKLLQARIDETK